LCLGKRLTRDELSVIRNRECDRPLNGSNIKVHGGNPPYHFQLDPGSGFPPIGIIMDLNGNLTGKVAKGARPGTFRACAVDLSESQSCQTMTIGTPGGPQANQQTGQSHALRNTLVIAGTGAAA